MFPTHYKMNTMADVRRLAQTYGFEVVDVRQVSTSATLQALGPIVWVELLFIRLLQNRALAQFRSNLVVTLRRAPG